MTYVGIGRLGWIAGGLAALFAAGCGRFVSWDDGWLLEGDDASASSSSVPASPSVEPPTETPTVDVPGGGCEAAPIWSYHYAEAPEFWLGSQQALGVRVEGSGHLVAGPASASPEHWRYLRAGDLSVAPDGTLELSPGEPALGYAPGSVAAGSCLVQLRAPVTSAPRPSSHIELRMNFDPRDLFTIFDIADPSGTSTASTSVLVFDSVGAPHVLDIYFAHAGGGLIDYYVLAEGGEIAAATPGWPVQLSAGTLQFTSDGALDSATTPALAVSFANLATPNQAIELSWGPDILNDGASGYEGSTMFATSTAVHSQAVDGFPAGTGSAIDVASDGHVTVEFDNGSALDIGALALARFPHEAALAPLGAQAWAATVESGGPQFAAPLLPGRGALVVTSRP